MGLRSLRIGGTTALYRAGHNVESIKRFVRWTSSTVHSYLWVYTEKQHGLAERMAATTGLLPSPRGLWTYVT